jgi:hypothetical protein
MFVASCDALEVPRVFLPAADSMLALYLQTVVHWAKTFALVNAASDGIALYQKVHLFDHEPTQSPAVCIVRSAATRRLGLNNKNRKEIFEWV